VSREQRLRRLEDRGGGDGRVNFTICVPPAGLTATEHAAWSAEHRREAEARRAFWFTMDLGSANVNG
jgi:hypothetical protein